MTNNPQPALLPLTIYRNVDKLFKMEADQEEIQIQPIQQIQSKEETETHDHTPQELSVIKDIVEQQCYTYIVYYNKIHDRMKVQHNTINNFKRRANQLQVSLDKLQSLLLRKASALNRRIDLIEKTLCSKPIYKSITPENEDGRITGIAYSQTEVVTTTIYGKLNFFTRDTLVPKNHKSYRGKALFSPKFWNDIIFCLSADSELLFSYSDLPLSIALDGATNSFSFSSLIATDLVGFQFHLMTGHQGCVKLHTIERVKPKSLDISNDNEIDLILKDSNEENGLNQTQGPPVKEPSINQVKYSLTTVSTIKGIRGNVLQLLHDPILDSIFLLTSKRIVYSISSTTSQIINSIQFDTIPMQIALTRCFIVVSLAPNSIILMHRNREKFTEVKRIEITSGLRRFCCGVKELYILTKKQTIERRMLSNVTLFDNICEPIDSDYDEEAYIGVIEVNNYDIFISHDHRMTQWG